MATTALLMAFLEAVSDILPVMDCAEERMEIKVSSIKKNRKVLNLIIGFWIGVNWFGSPISTKYLMNAERGTLNIR